MSLKINLGVILDLLNNEIIDDLIIFDTYSYDNKISFKYINDNKTKEYIITIKENELEKLIKESDED